MASSLTFRFGWRSRRLTITALVLIILNLENVIATNSSSDHLLSYHIPAQSPIRIVQSLPASSDHYLHQPMFGPPLNASKSTNCDRHLLLSGRPIQIRTNGSALHRTECTFQLLSKPLSAKSIRLEIHLIDLRASSGCVKDHVLIVTDRGLQHRLCGSITNRSYEFNSSQVTLHFRSTLKGSFYLSVRLVDHRCRDHITIDRIDMPFRFTSPNFPEPYPNDFDCWTQIDAGKLLQNGALHGHFEIELQTIELEPDTWCLIDFVELFPIKIDFETRTKPIVRFCEPDQVIRFESETKSSLETTRKIHINGSTFYVHMQTDSLVSQKGFEMMITFRSNQSIDSNSRSESVVATPTESMPQCPEFRANLDKYEIKSPNYPIGYPPNMNCWITLKTQSPNQSIHLTSKSFIMEPDDRCSFDRLEIYDLSRSSEALRFCGKSGQKLNYTSQSSLIYLHLISDDFGEFPGFVIEYQFENGIQHLSKSIPKSDANQLQFLVRPADAEVQSGSSHLLHCQVQYTNRTTGRDKANDDDSLPLISWYKDNLPIPSEMLLPNRSTLLIRQFDLSSVGVYSCRVQHLIARALLQLRNTTTDSCEILFQRRPTDQTLVEGDYPIFECNAVSSRFGRLRTRWYYNDRVLEITDRVQVLHNNYLIINGVQRNDSGFYHCVVTNLDQPNCGGQSIAHVLVRTRQNVSELCGQPLLNPDIAYDGHPMPKIVGGNDAIRGQFPWQVMFWTAQRNAFCGGALLNDRWVISAAHCFRTTVSGMAPPSLDTIYVKLGKHDQQTVEPSEIVARIKEVQVHPQFNSGTFDNDLALVQLNQDVIFNDYVQPICVDESDTLQQAFFDTIDVSRPASSSFFSSSSTPESLIKYGHVTGWGQVRENGVHPRYLQHLRLPLVDKSQCMRSTSFKVTRNMFCAGYALESVTDACKGDSGGPMVARLHHRWTLIGLVSWGEGCARNGKYGFYTRIANYVHWIQAFIQL